MYIHNQLSTGLTTTVAQQTTRIPKQIIEQDAPVPSMQSLEVHTWRTLQKVGLPLSVEEELCQYSLLSFCLHLSFLTLAAGFYQGWDILQPSWPLPLCAHTDRHTRVSRRRAVVKKGKGLKWMLVYFTILNRVAHMYRTYCVCVHYWRPHPLAAAGESRAEAATYASSSSPGQLLPSCH